MNKLYVAKRIPSNVIPPATILFADINCNGTIKPHIQ